MEEEEVDDVVIVRGALKSVATEAGARAPRVAVRSSGEIGG